MGHFMENPNSDDTLGRFFSFCYDSYLNWLFEKFMTRTVNDNIYLITVNYLSFHLNGENNTYKVILNV